MLREAREIGLDGVLLTEHNQFTKTEPLEAMAREMGVKALRGAEYSSGGGHILLAGLRDDDLFRQPYYRPPEEVITYIHGLGGVAVVAHPFRPQSEQCMRRIYDPEFRGLDAVETINGGIDQTEEQNRLAREAAITLGLPQTGGSDAHSRGFLGRAVTVFDEPVESLADLIRQIRAGTCHPEGRTGR